MVGFERILQKILRRLAREGFVVFAPDLHHGVTASTIEQAKELMERRDFERTWKEVIGTVDFLKTHPKVHGPTIGVVGFSMGGDWAFCLSTKKPDDVTAIVVFYGIGEETDFSKPKATFLGHCSENDEWEPLGSIRKVETLIRDAGRDVEFDFYHQVKHWFFEENRPEFDATAAALAWKRTTNFLHAKLG